MATLDEKLLIYAENSLNVMLIGTHGIGKTTVVKNVAERLGLKFKYYSSSTLDPWSELIGIPVPDAEKAKKTGEKVIDFYRPADLDNAEFVFFDELNRVTNPRVLQTVLEIIQFKSINGTPLKNLKMVWAAINPPGNEYQVEELDPALVDRFHMYIKMKAHVSIDYMKDYMSEDVARVMKKWWDQDLDTEQRRLLTPRRVEYIGMMTDKNIPWRDAIPQGHTFPIPNLEKRLSAMKNPENEIIIDKTTILEKTDLIVKMVKKSPQYAIKISDIVKDFSDDETYQCKDLIENLPQELIQKIGIILWVPRKRIIVKLFIKNKIDVTGYPKFFKGFGLKEIYNELKS